MITSLSLKMSFKLSPNHFKYLYHSILKAAGIFLTCLIFHLIPFQSMLCDLVTYLQAIAWLHIYGQKYTVTIVLFTVIVIMPCNIKPKLIKLGCFRIILLH